MRKLEHLKPFVKFHVVDNVSPQLLRLALFVDRAQSHRNLLAAACWLAERSAEPPEAIFKRLLRTFNALERGASTQ